MALPQKGDPRRPLHLAIRSIRLLGIIFLLLGSCVSIVFFLPAARGRGAKLGGLLAMLVYVGPGVAYLIFSIFLKERKFWAVVAALVLASLQLIVVLVSGIVIGASVATRGIGPRTGDLLGFVFALGLVGLALSQLIYHLALSFESIKYIPLEVQRGFEPVMPPPPIQSAAGEPENPRRG